MKSEKWSEMEEQFKKWLKKNNWIAHGIWAKFGVEFRQETKQRNYREFVEI
jgi:hypothetical protein